MFIQNTIYTQKTVLPLFHKEDVLILPSASSVILYRANQAAPNLSVVATYDVLTEGAEVKTGLYSLSMDTSAEEPGTMVVEWTWTSSVTGLTYTESGQFNIVADSSAVIARVDGLATTLIQRPPCDNANIMRIAQSLGVDKKGDPMLFNSIYGTLKTTNKIYEKIDAMQGDTSEIKIEVRNTKSNVEKTLDSYNQKQMKQNIAELKSAFDEAVMKMAKMSAIVEEATTGNITSNMLRAFDIWAKQLAIMFSKVDFVLDGIQDIQDTQVDFAQALPSMVVKEQMETAQRMQQGQMAQRPQPGQVM